MINVENKQDESASIEISNLGVTQL